MRFLILIERFVFEESKMPLDITLFDPLVLLNFGSLRLCASVQRINFFFQIALDVLKKIGLRPKTWEEAGVQRRRKPIPQKPVKLEKRYFCRKIILIRFYTNKLPLRPMRYILDLKITTIQYCLLNATMRINRGSASGISRTLRIKRKVAQRKK